MAQLTFTIHGPPVPKARARVFQQRDKRTGKVATRAITPDKTKAYEQHVKMCALAARLRAEQKSEKWPLDAVYGLAVRVYRSRDAGDYDNYWKSVADGCEGALWDNDRRIRRCGEGGIWEAEKGRERVEVTAWVVDMAMMGMEWNAK